MINFFKDKQKMLGVALSFLLCFVPLSSTINNIIDQTIGATPLDSYVLNGLLFLSIIYATILTLFPFKWYCAVPMAFFVLSYIATLVLFPRNHAFMWTTMADLVENPLYHLFLYSIPALFLSTRLSDTKSFLKILNAFSVVTIVFSFILFTIGLESKKGDVALQYMTFSYNLLLPTTFLILTSIHKFRIINVALAFLGFAMIFLAGCRGALVSALAVLLVYVLFFGKIKKRLRALIIFVLLILVLLVAFYYDDFLQAIKAFCYKYNIDSRTLEYLLAGDFLNDSGRAGYTEIISNNLSFWGNGLYADRLLLRGTYVHNLFYEILYSYGLFFGNIIILAFSAIVLYGLFKSDERGSIILCVFISAGFFKLFFSSSFLLIEPAFFAMIGFAFNVVFSKKTELSETDETTV